MQPPEIGEKDLVEGREPDLLQKLDYKESDGQSEVAHCYLHFQ